MNRMLRVFLTMTLTVAFILMNTCAMAATTLPPKVNKAEIISSFDLSYSGVVLNRNNGILMVKDYSTDLYSLFAPDGTKLTSEPYIGMSWETNMFQVKIESGVNKRGMVDATGRLVVPMQYERVIEVSDRWQIGEVYVKGNLFNKEFKGEDGNFYKYGYSDVYFNGNLVGTVETQDYATAYGDYLYLDGKFYDSTMTANDYKYKGFGDMEYDVTGNGTFHTFTGQQVGVPGCTLTSEEVRNDIVIVGKNIVDLQGNLYGTIEKDYDEMRCFNKGYAQVWLDDKAGLIDATGKEVIPCEYDEICAYGYANGYMSVIKDGKVIYINEKGQITYETGCTTGELYNYSWAPKGWKYNDDGTITAISAIVGELPQTFDVVNMEAEGGPLFAGVIPSERAGVFDIYGNEIIPADGKYNNVYDFNISNDGSVIVADKEFGESTIYLMSDAYGMQSDDTPEKPPIISAAPEIPAESEPVQSGQPAPQPETQPEQPADDVEWICTCGSVNNGNFCPQCGNPRPEELKCTSCGYVPPADTTPKFCAECGAPF